ncbi:MAG: DUF4435 domain-containing protein [Zymomonas mobilis]|uniref:hypothetical protein n=1 Tax=Zymomonas mobilis TaxID=542 RepID=UPI0039EAC13D
MASFKSYLTNPEYVSAYPLEEKDKEKGIVYVEDENDIHFWEEIINSVANGRYNVGIAGSDEKRRGKRFLETIYNEVNSKVIIAVDSDYDYICPESRKEAKKLISSPFILHTFSYGSESVRYSNKLLKSVIKKIKYSKEFYVDIEYFILNISKIIYKSFVLFAFLKNKNSNFVEDKDFKTIFDIGLNENELLRLDDRNNFSFNDEIITRIKNKSDLLRSKYRDILKKNSTFLELKHYVGRLKSLGLTKENTCRFICSHAFEDKIILPILREIKQNICTLEKKIIGIEKAEDNFKKQNFSKINKHFKNKCSIETLIHSNDSYKDDAIYKRILVKASKAVE